MPSVREKVGQLVLPIVLGIGVKEFSVLPNLTGIVAFIVFGKEKGIAVLSQILIG